MDEEYVIVYNNMPKINIMKKVYNKTYWIKIFPYEYERI